METSKQFRFLLDLLHSERQLKKKFHNLNKIFDTFLSWWMIIKWIRWMIITIGNFHIMNWNKFLPWDHSELTVLNKEQQVLVLNQAVQGLIQLGLEQLKESSIHSQSGQPLTTLYS